MSSLKGLPPELPTEEQVVNELARLRRRRKRLRAFRRFVCIFPALLLAAVLPLSLCTVFLSVSELSPAPPLKQGDTVCFLKRAELRSGELCGYKLKDSLLTGRIIAGPADFCSLDSQEKIFINGRELREKYCPSSPDIRLPEQLSEGQYLVLGSGDELCLISSEQAVGRAALRLWPLSEITLISGEEIYK